MRDTLITVCVAVVAVASIVTSLGMVWLCATTTTLLRSIERGSQKNLEAADILQCTVIDALAAIQEEVAESKSHCKTVVEKLNVSNELGYQNAEANDRIESAAAVVASDLSHSIERADSTPKNGPVGAAADAALRSGEVEHEGE